MRQRRTARSGCRSEWQATQSGVRRLCHYPSRRSALLGDRVPAVTDEICRRHGNEQSCQPGAGFRVLRPMTRSAVPYSDSQTSVAVRGGRRRRTLDATVVPVTVSLFALALDGLLIVV